MNSRVNLPQLSVWQEMSYLSWGEMLRCEQLENPINVNLVEEKKMNKRTLLVAIVLLACALLSACASPTPTSVPVIQVTSTVRATVTATVIAPTNTPEPTATQTVGVVKGRIAFQ